MLARRSGSIRAVVMDFGLAHEMSGENAGGISGHTAPGAVLGTPKYMAPEQFEGKEVTPATDLFAFGIVLYEMLTSRSPFPSSNLLSAAVLRGKRPESASSLQPGVPHRLELVIGKCLEYEPSRRFQSAGELARALRARYLTSRYQAMGRPWVVRVAGIVIAAVIILGAAMWWQSRQYYHPNPEAERWYNAGLASMHEGNYVKATRLLQAAIGQDQHFVMAHARLAEAWYNLDFQGNAQRELLVALPERRRLPSLDAGYLDAIDATVMGDSAAAIRNYRWILDQSGADDKSPGYVNLGMAYERAGDVNDALESYSRAAQADTNNPASYMRTGVLQSRLHHVKEGEQAFDRAEAIFTAEINPEGLAELDYQRGYAANDRVDPKTAIPFLQRSLDEAQKIPSIQLEIRALTQLSVAERDSDQDALAVEDATQAIELARDNQLEPWAADGLVRLAAAELDQEHLKQAEQTLQEAMRVLAQSPQPRVEAMANLTLASLMNQDHLPAKVIAPAQAALQYYKSHGFFSNASIAALLLIRTERDQGQYKQALTSGNDFLALAAQSGIPHLRILAEDVVGTVYLAMEQYPDALTHFQNARLLVTQDSLRAYMELHCGNALWKLGRYPESEAMYKLASGNPSLLESVSESRVESLLSRQKYAAALKLAKQVLAGNPEMVADRKMDLEQDETVAEAHLGMKTQARAGLSSYFLPDQPDANPDDSAQNKLAAAEIYLSIGMSQQAHDAALAAHDYFASSGQPDSELQSAGLAAAASKSLKDDAGYRLFSKKILDILLQIQQTWGPEAYQKYVSRPDVHSLTIRATQRTQ